MHLWSSRLCAAILFLLCVAHQPALARCTPRPLNILLTNDDGYDRPGIRALKDVLDKAGHHVVIAGPVGNYSGASVSMTRGEIATRKEANGVYAISGSPATTVLVGAQMLYATRAPDLVLSGINEGANLGSNIVLSGTVGAALAAAVVVEPSLAAIAVSANLPERDALSKANRKHFRDVAKFVAAAIKALSAEACDSPLLPPGTILNINYPAQPPKKVQGVRLTRPAASANVGLVYRENGAGSYALAAVPRSTQAAEDTDVGAIAAGFISVSPLAGHYLAAPDDIARPLLHLRP